MGELLAAVGPIPGLFPAQHLAAICALPDLFGSSITWALLECRLRGQPRTDFAVFLSAGESRTRLRDRLLDDPARWPEAWRGAGLGLVAWLLPGHPVSEAR